MSEADINQAVELFKSRDPRKRRWALDMAVELGTLEASALLIKALQDQSWSLREYAVEKAVQMGRRMTAPLCHLLKSGIWFSRAAAVKALDQIGEAAALGPLCLAANDDNRTVSESAQKAVWSLLLKMSAEELLERARAMSPEQREALAGFLGQSDPELGASLRRLDQRLAEDQERVNPDDLQRLRAALRAGGKQETEHPNEET